MILSGSKSTTNKTFTKNSRSLITGISHNIGKIIIIGWVAFTITVIGWVFLASISTTKEIFTNQLLKSGLHWGGYTILFKQYNMGRYFINSLVYTTVTCVGLILVCAPCSYALSNYNFLGKKLITSAFASAMGLPGIMLMAPLFMMVISLNIKNSVFTLWAIYIGTGLPGCMFYLLGFFSTIPKEVQEAALVEGASHTKAFWKVVLPLAQPGIVTVTIFNFMGYWNEYIWALTLASDKDKRTLAVALQSIVQGMGNTGNYPGLFASVIIVFFPTLVMFILLQDKIIGNITAGSVKG